MSLPNTPSASSASSPTPPPPTITPTLQPPTNAGGTPRRPPKLRSSCDACGAAKVRCDKTQPRCGRCVAGGLNCVYGLSRKFGKAPRKKPPVDTSVSGDAVPRPLAQNAQQQQQQQHQQQLHHQQQQQQLHNQISCCPLDLRHYSDPAPRSLEYETTNTSSFGLGDVSMAMSSYGNHDLFMRSPTSLDNVLDDPFSFTDHPSSLGPDSRLTVDPLDLTFHSSDSQSFADWIHPDDLMHTPESQDMDTTSSHSSHESHHQHLLDTSMMASDSHLCHKLAYSTLETLSFRQENLTKEQHLTQTMDKVLNRNKQAVNNLHQLLKCPCSKSPHLAMLYASITSKILMWYQLAAGCTKPTATWDYFPTVGSNPTPPLSASSSPSMAFVEPSSPMSQANFIVTPMQFSVGAFSVDDEAAQEALRKQLLLSELKKAGNLIDLLSIHGRDELATGEVNDIYSALATWLKCELNRTVGTLKANF